MVKAPNFAAVVISLILNLPLRVSAQNAAYVTLYSTTNVSGVNFAVQTNQIVSLVGYDWVHQLTIYGSLIDGTKLPLNPCGTLAPTTSLAVGMSQIPQIFTGLTNISVQPYFALAGSATFQISTPTSVNVVSNYVPADAIVIPASATGNVQIILESSMDLLNWTAASPGTYGASSATNRFFRVRAVVTN